MILFYWLAAIGICFIIKHGSILESFRERTSNWFSPLKKLYKCCLCLGFWVGLSMIPVLVYKEGWTEEVVYFPFTCSAICWYADCTMNLINAQANYFNSGSSISSSSGSLSSTPNK